MVYIGELWLLWAKKFVGMKDFKSSLEDRLTTISIKRYSCSGISAVSVWDAGSNSLALLEEFENRLFNHSRGEGGGIWSECYAVRESQDRQTGWTRPAREFGTLWFACISGCQRKRRTHRYDSHPGTRNVKDPVGERRRSGVLECEQLVCWFEWVRSDDSGGRCWCVRKEVWAALNHTFIVWLVFSVTAIWH